MVEFLKEVPSIRFMALRRWWYAISAIVVVASILLVAVRGLNLTVDFTGGVVFELGFAKPVDLEDVRGALAAGGVEDFQVRTYGTASELEVRLPPSGGSSAEVQGGRVLDLSRGHVVDQVAAVGDHQAPVGLAQARRRQVELGGDVGQPLARMHMPEPHHLDRQREPAQRLHLLGGVGDDHTPARGLPDQLLAQQRRAAALDQRQARPDLVGPVDRQVDPLDVVQPDDGDAQLPRQFGRGVGGRHALDVQFPRRQRLDEPGGGRAGAQAHHHAGLDQLGRGLAGRLLLGVGVHGAGLA